MHRQRVRPHRTRGPLHGEMILPTFVEHQVVVVETLGVSRHHGSGLWPRDGVASRSRSSRDTFSISNRELHRSWRHGSDDANHTLSLGLCVEQVGTVYDSHNHRAVHGAVHRELGEVQTGLADVHSAGVNPGTALRHRDRECQVVPVTVGAYVDAVDAEQRGHQRGSACHPW